MKPHFGSLLFFFLICLFGEFESWDLKDCETTKSADSVGKKTHTFFAVRSSFSCTKTQRNHSEVMTLVSHVTEAVTSLKDDQTDWVFGESIRDS